VIHILKWNGKEYKIIWSSKPLGEIRQILVDDITGDGKKEILLEMPVKFISLVKNEI